MIAGSGTSYVAPACRICGNQDGNSVYNARERMYGTNDEFEYLRCAECGCQQIIEVPANLGKYYPDDYYSFSTEPLHGLRKTVTRIRNEGYFRGALGGIAGRMVSKVLPNPKLAAVARIRPRRDARILDVGCGGGEVLVELARVGFTRLAGIDPYLPDTIELDHGITARKASVEDIQGEEYDLIMMHHVFEHMPDPIATLTAVRGLLSDDGVVVVRIPLADSWASRHYGACWVQHDAPRHLFLHTGESLKRAASAAGLSISHIVYDSSEAQIWGSELYQNDISLLSVPRRIYGNPLRRLLSPRFIRYRAMTRKLNRQGRGDQAAFYLKRARAGQK